MKWFRFHTEALDDPKVQRLSPQLFKTWVNLLCIASQNGGKLLGIDDMAFKLRLSSQEVEQQLSDLILAGLIDIDPDKSMTPHNWQKRQYASDDSKERVRKHRAKQKETPGNAQQDDTVTTCNGDVTVTVTPPDTEQITDTDDVDDARARDWKEVRSKLIEAAGEALASEAVAPGLANLSTPLWWLDEGADFDRDVLPAVAEVAKRRAGKSKISTWDYFNGAVAAAKAKREQKLDTFKAELAAGVVADQKSRPRKTFATYEALMKITGAPAS